MSGMLTITSRNWGYFGIPQGDRTMKVRNPREKSLGLAVMFGLSHLLLAGHGAIAQEAADEATIEEIFVVGSRIAAYEDDAALPVSVTDADDIARSGAPTVAEVIARTPFNSAWLPRSGSTAVF